MWSRWSQTRLRAAAVAVSAGLFEEGLKPSGTRHGALQTRLKSGRSQFNLIRVSQTLAKCVVESRTAGRSARVRSGWAAGPPDTSACAGTAKASCLLFQADTGRASGQRPTCSTDVRRRPGRWHAQPSDMNGAATCGLHGRAQENHGRALLDCNTRHMHRWSSAGTDRQAEVVRERRRTAKWSHSSSRGPAGPDRCRVGCAAISHR